ncbi:MAG: type II toxin-antitoxin system HipA family toxin [Gammaproteobacteria bacterium]|nr:type II toxin-antitoxin system HipA family toxin [Gammaproteobacteria bacterium]
MMTIAEVRLWDKTIGAVSWDNVQGIANFEYDPAFRGSGIQVAPVMMPLSDRVYSFPVFSGGTFHGLPGLLADSLPDDFGNALIDSWLAKEGRDPGHFNPVERLCYIGTRGMGALEFAPAHEPRSTRSSMVEISALVKLASEILTKRNDLKGSFAPPERKDALNDILQVGTSAGGARAKAIVAWNPDKDEVRSGQIAAGEGFTYWLLKFDGVSGNKDKELEDPKGYGLIEYAYYKMALEAGITMLECRLLKENGRSHFMAKRFDRTSAGEKIHMQSLGAMQHFDYRKPGAHSYEEALRTIRDLGMSMDFVEEQYRRMAFNVIARNQDDHVKNIAYLMDKAGKWSLSPAYDMTYSYNPTGAWTGTHQMTLNGKRENYTLADFRECAANASMKKSRVIEIVKQVQDAVKKWKGFSSDAGVSKERERQIANTHVTNLVK